MDIDKIKILYQPEITDDQLWDFYVRNDICEAGHGKEAAVKPLRYNPYIVAAFYGDRLVGIIRAMFDGLSADIMEFCLECGLQGDNLKYENGSIVEADKYGIAKRMGELLICKLRELGNTFVTAYAVEGAEEQVYESIGLVQNKGHVVYVKDERPYVKNERERS
jgi:hypothetical protein